MSRDICVCLDFLTDAHKEQILRTAAKGGMHVEFFTSAQRQEALAFVAGAEVLYSSIPDVFRAGKDLKWYCCAFAGVDIYSHDPSLFPNDTCVLTNSNVFGLTIAEHTIMTALMLLRRQPEYMARVADHRWQGGLPIRSLHGIRAVLLGTGQIGRSIAARLRAFGPAAIVGVNRSGHPAEGFDETYPVGELDRVLTGAELLIMAVPRTGETKHILSRERLALLPKDAYVINVGRGTAVDQQALMDALNGDKLAGAALDVVDPEPLPPDHPLWTTKNLLLTPHISGNMALPYTCDRNVDSFCGDLENYMAGRPLAHVVDCSRGY